ncbi:DUF732 domain-containing protein [Rhodococcus sp. NPDC058505]|uniref:DUF732 domain-containing protein n=1 Tax=unclassified Rhodococcus (in: high G+C Gram-positive bacteria) TaxID=192944 RepID=UPI003654748A
MLVSSRSPFARVLAVGAFAALSVGVLAGCGSDDSTASSTPTLTTAAGSGSPTVPPLATGIEVPAYTTPSVAATAPPETPEAVPSGFPGPTEAPALDDRGRAYLEALKKGGVTPADNGDIAISTANYICAAKESNVAEDEILAYVTGMAGVEAGLAGGTPTDEDATKAARVYIDAAQSTYCK